MRARASQPCWRRRCSFQAAERQSVPPRHRRVAAPARCERAELPALSKQVAVWLVRRASRPQREVRRELAERGASHRRRRQAPADAPSTRRWPPPPPLHAHGACARCCQRRACWQPPP
eukprot:scaffold259889_cov24-Tisochrysis_lutea.AAC.3